MVRAYPLDDVRPEVLGGVGSGPVPQVLANTSFIISIAMSQRTPSAWSPREVSVSTAAVRKSSLKALSWTTSGQGAKYGSRPRA